MNTVFSTVDVHPRDRFDYWHSVACKTIVPHDSEPSDRLSFSAKLSEARIGDIDLISFENSPMRVSHTERHARSSNPDELLLCLHSAKSLLVEQDGREAQLTTGDIVLLDPARPYRAHFQSNSKLLVFKVPRILLAAHTVPARGLTAFPIRPTAGAAGLVSNILAALPQHVAKLDSNVHAIVQCHLLDLMGIALAQASDQVHVSHTRWLGVARIKSEATARLADPALNAARVADAANVSIRHANSLLAREGTSLARLIKDMRLARVKAALNDVALDSVSIKEIASRWGFSDMTHFGRMFKKKYGSTPRDYRKGAVIREP
ncbi:MAG: AraC-like ligand-binding domain-containing protein [Limisphaerales bacterium]